MESKDWAFERTVDRDFLDAHLELIDYISTSLRRQMADHIFGLLQQDDAICIQRGEMTMHNDDARKMVSFEETLRVRPLVLCKDCAFSCLYNERWRLPIEPEKYWCKYRNEEASRYDYCSYGERKEEVGKE